MISPRTSRWVSILIAVIVVVAMLLSVVAVALDV